MTTTLARRFRTLALASASILLGGCTSSQTAPEHVDVTGNWGGTTCAPNHILSCSIVLRLAQTGTSITGTYNYTTDGGTVTGTISGQHVSMTFSFYPGVPSDCVEATVGGNEMVGKIGCGPPQRDLVVTRGL